MRGTAMRKCLVIGADGFIGSHVMTGHELFARELGATLVASPSSIDIRDAAAVRELILAHAPDHVLHLAAVSFVPDSIADPAATYQINFIGTLNVLAALSAVNFRGSMLFVSSAEVYGAVTESDLPLRETGHFAPRTPYAVSKAASELLCMQHALTGNLDVRIARPFNVIGPGQSSKFAVSSFARQIADFESAGGGNIDVGNLDVTRDFVDVADVVTAFAAILRGGRPGEAYNICSGAEVRMSVLLDRLLALAKVRVQATVDPARVRPTEQRRVLGSYAKLAEEAGWRPLVDLDSTLDSVLSFWRARSREHDCRGNS